MMNRESDDWFIFAKEEPSIRVNRESDDRFT